MNIAGLFDLTGRTALVTGGNSGSPLLNARGEVIGLVFDCNWESMTRDFNFDQDLHRVICLDIRYVLFIKDFGVVNICAVFKPTKLSSFC